MIPSLSNISSHYPLMLHLNLFYLYFDLHCEFSVFFNFLFIGKQLFCNVVGFLPYNNASRLQSHRCRLPPEPPSCLLPPQSAWLSSPLHNVSSAVYLTHGSVRESVLLSPFVPFSPSPIVDFLHVWSSLF